MMRTDIEVFSKYGRMFGFGQHVSTDISEQGAGLIPDSAYFNQRFPNWGPGFTINLGVGQGDMGVTPLQLARYVAAVASRGMLYTPHLVTRMVHQETGEILYPKISAPQKATDRRGAFRSGARRHETGDGGRDRKVDSDSRYSQRRQKPVRPRLPMSGRTDSVFILFAPYDNPQIAVAVQVENAGFGAVVAGPIGSLMAEQYLTGSISASPPEAMDTSVRACGAE